MANKVDKHVVQMEFDNAAFERKVSTTRTSLKNLKKDLEFEGNVENLSKFEKGLSSLTNKIKGSSSETANSMRSLQSSFNGIDMTKIQSNIESLSSRFSTLGIVGMTAVQRITNSLIDFGSKVANSTFGQIFSGGKTRALNLEQAQFQIKGLKVDWESTATDLGVSLKDQINQAVSGTAFGLDSAAKVAGQLLASNIKAGTKEMQNALSGISGVAAMTNSSYDDIGRIFTTIAGNGRIMSEQLNQFSSRGLNAAATLADYLKVDEATLREMVTKGQVDFKTFSAAMNEAFGEQATKANDTYTGALSNVRAALSRIGANVYTPYLDNMRQVFVALIPVLNGVNKALEPFFKILEKGMVLIRSTVVKQLERLAYLTDDGLKLTGLQKLADFMDWFGKKFNEESKSGESAINYFGKSLKYIVYTLETIKNYLSKGFFKQIINGFSMVAKKGTNPVLSAFRLLYKATRDIFLSMERLTMYFNWAINNNGFLSKSVAVLVLAFKALVGILSVLAKTASRIVKIGLTVLRFVIGLVTPFLDLILALYDTFIVSEKLYEIFKPMLDSFKKLKATVSSVTSTFAKFVKVGLMPANDKTKESLNIWSYVISGISKALTALSNAATFCFTKLNSLIDNNQGYLYRYGFKAGSAIRSVIDWFQEFFSSWDGVQGLFSRISGYFKTFKESVSSTVASFKDIKTTGIEQFTINLKSSLGPLQAIGRFLVSFWELLKSIAVKIFPIIKSVITVLFDGLSNVFLIIRNAVSGLQVPDTTNFLVSGGIIALITMMLKKVEKIVDKIDGISANFNFKNIQTFFNSLTNYVKQLSKLKAAEVLKAFAISILEIAIAMVLLASIDPTKLVAPMIVISLLITELTALFKAIAEKTDKFPLRIKAIASVILSMASSVLILAIAIKALSKIHPTQLMSSFLVVSLLLGEIALIVFAFSHAGTKQISKGASVLIAMAIAVTILSKAISNLANSDASGNKIFKITEGISFLILALGGALMMAAKNTDGIIKASIALLVASTGLSKLGGVLVELAKYDYKSVLAASIALGVLIFSLKSLFSLSEKEFEKISKSIRSLAFSLVIMAAAFAMFEKVDDKSLERAGKALLGVMAAFVFFAVAAKYVKTNALIEIGTAIAGIGIALAGLGAAAYLLEKVKWETLGKAGAALVALLGSVILLGKIKLNFDDVKGMALAMVAIAGGLTVLGVALTIFTLVPILGIVKGLGALIITLGVLVGLTYALKHAGNVEVLFTFAKGMAMIGVAMAAMSVALALFAATLPILAISMGSLKLIFIGLLEIVAALAPKITDAIIALVEAACDGVIRSFDIIKKTLVALLNTGTDITIDLLPKAAKLIDALFEAIIPLLVKWVPKLVDGFVELIIGVIRALANRVPDLVDAMALLFKNLFVAFKEAFSISFNEETLRGFLVGLSIFTACIIAIAFAAKLAQKSLLGMVALVALVGLMTFAIMALVSIDTDKFLSVTTGLSKALISLSVCLFLISKCPIMPALEGVGSLLVFITAMTAVIIAFGELGKINEIDTLIQRGAELLGMIGTAVGEFVGNIIGSMLGSVSSALPIIADNFSLFMLKLQPFLIGLRMIDESILEGAGRLAGVILAFTVAEVIDGMARLFGSNTSIADFGQQLVDFAPYMVKFSNIVSGIDVPALLLASMAAEKIADFASKLPNQGGWLGGIMGENNMDLLGPQLETFAAGLVSFSNYVRGNMIDLDAVDIACQAGVKIADMAKQLPNEGGWLGGIVGENNMDLLGPQLGDFAGGLVAFSNNVRGNMIDLKAVDIACQAGVLIANMAKELPNEGGWLGGIVGENSMDKLEPQLRPFARAIVGFSNIVDGERVNLTAVKIACQAGTEIATLARRLPNQGGIVSWFTGDNKLSTFGQEMAKFATQLTKFSKNLEGADLTQVRSVATLIADMSSMLPREGGLISWFKGEVKISELGKEFAKFGKSLGEFSKNIKDVNLTTVRDAFNAVIYLINRLPATGGIKSWFTGEVSLSSFGKDLVEFSKKLKEFSKQIEDVNMDRVRETIAALGSVEVTSFLDAFRDAEKPIAEAVNMFMGYLTNFIGEYSYYSEGEYMVATVCKGMTNSDSKEAIYSAVKSVAKLITSPFSSNWFNQDVFWIGGNFCIGLANGIYMNSYQPTMASERVAQQIIDAAMHTLRESSPSKEARLIGGNWDIGLANGLTQYGGVVANASEQVSQEVIDHVSRIQNAVNNIDLNAEPSSYISPIVDLSNVRRGAGDISRIMGDSTSYLVSSNIARANAELDKMSNVIRVEASNKDVVDAVAKLESRIDSLGDRINRMYVTIDGKTVVGELLDPIDKGLGTRVYRNNGGVRSGRVVQR